MHGRTTGWNADLNPPPPTVTAIEAEDVTHDSATLVGKINPNGPAVEVWFEYSTTRFTDSVCSTCILAPIIDEIEGTIEHTVYLPISGLDPGTVYYYRLAAKSLLVSVESSPRSFSTDAMKPTVVTGSATNLSGAGATLNGQVNPNWLSARYWFVWGTDSSSLSNQAPAVPVDIPAGSSDVDVTVNISGLTPGQIYYFRVVAENSAGLSDDGNIEEFSTSNIPPVAKAGPDISVDTDYIVTLDGSASTPGSSTINSWSWAQLYGPPVVLSNATTSTATFTAPGDVNGSVVLRFKLTVTNDLGVSASDEVDITVNEVVTVIPPVADAGADMQVNGGANVTLNGSASTGSIDSWSWTQISGPPVILTKNTSSPVATFTAPDAGADLVFRLTVSNKNGDFASDEVNVTVIVPPVANAGADVQVNGAASVTLNGSASTGSIDSWLWTQISGPSVALSNATTSTATFIAPDEDAILVFRLTVSNSHGFSAYDEVEVKVVKLLPPTVNAGPDMQVNEGAGVTLTGSATPGSGAISSWLWTQTSGPTVTLSNAATSTATFTAPGGIADNVVLVFRLTVSDTHGLTAYDDVEVKVTKLLPPTVNAGSDVQVNEGAGVTLTGSATPGSGSIASWLWTQTSGPTVTLSNAATSTATFTAPSGIADNVVLVFRLTVLNSHGLSAYDDVEVKVIRTAVANPPIVNAGVDMQVDGGVGVTLTGSATPGSGAITSWSWTQISGPTVTLSNAATSTATFTAPDENTVLVFRLTVANSYALSAYDDVEVTVTKTAVANPPVANAGGDMEVYAGDNVVLDGSASTPGDGVITSWLWTQISGPTVTVKAGDSAAVSYFIVPDDIPDNTVLQFRLRVDNSLGAFAYDDVNIKVTGVVFVFRDDFDTNNLAWYSPPCTPSACVYNSASGRMEISLSGSSSYTVGAPFPSGQNLTSGKFYLDFYPNGFTTSNAGMMISLCQSDGACYRVQAFHPWAVGESNGNFGAVQKIATNGTTVTAEVRLPNSGGTAGTGYDQRINYHLVITFDPTQITFEGFGKTATLVTPGLNVNSFKIEAIKQSAYFDNIRIFYIPGP